MNKQANQRGIVSVFLVVFTALLITIVTASFIQIMLRNQQQATNNDLSQSAYDSALAGVEDAKRLLVQLQKCKEAGNGECVRQITIALDASDCTTTQVRNIAEFVDGEVQVGDARLNQAYTCVKVTSDTFNIEDELSTVPDVKPVRTANGFATIRLSWFTPEDAGGENVTPTFPNVAGELPVSDDWPRSQPPLLRAQIIQFEKGQINLNAFNQPNNNNALSIFLYPSDGGGNNSYNLETVDTRLERPSSNSPKLVNCEDEFSDGGTAVAYLCSVELRVPLPAGVSSANREAYLQLDDYYGDPSSTTHYRIEVLDDAGQELKLLGVQPIVDSTGRASDLFRRVRARISVTDGATLPFPDTALYIKNNLCKDFFVTNETDEYVAEACDPSTSTNN